jgi:zinc D-Ala-D-Ala dipeptidase
VSLLKIRYFNPILIIFFANPCIALHRHFVYLSDIDSSIMQDIRYAGCHNFIGRPVNGYERGTCILTKQAAFALKEIQTAIKPMGLSLKVYDCYRPVCAVKDFVSWSNVLFDQKMKQEFYPRTSKKSLFELDYIAKVSGHSRGSTADITLVDRSRCFESPYSPGQRLIPCFAPWSKRFRENSIDMGSGYDCMDRVAHANSKEISKKAQANRRLLRHLMLKHGFVNLMRKNGGILP